MVMHQREGSAIANRTIPAMSPYLTRREDPLLPNPFRAILVLGLISVFCLPASPMKASHCHGSGRKSELVELQPFIPSLHLDIRYATVHNFVHRAVYREARAFLQRPAAIALAQANAAQRTLQDDPRLEAQRHRMTVQA